MSYTFYTSRRSPKRPPKLTIESLATPSSPVELISDEPDIISIVTLPDSPKKQTKETVTVITPTNKKRRKTKKLDHTPTEEQISESRQQFIDHFQEAFSGIIGASTLISGFSIANLTEIERERWHNEYYYDAYTTLLSLTSCFSLYSTLILTHCQSTIARANANDVLYSYINKKPYSTTKLIKRAENLIHESVNAFYMSIFTYIGAITVLKLQHFTFLGQILNIGFFFITTCKMTHSILKIGSKTIEKTYIEKCLSLFCSRKRLNMCIYGSDNPDHFHKNTMQILENIDDLSKIENVGFIRNCSCDEI